MSSLSSCPLFFERNERRGAGNRNCNFAFNFSDSETSRSELQIEEGQGTPFLALSCMCAKRPRSPRSCRLQKGKGEGSKFSSFCHHRHVLSSAAGPRIGNFFSPSSFLSLFLLLKFTTVLKRIAIQCCKRGWRGRGSRVKAN